MGEKEQEKKEGPRRIMVNSDEEIMKVLKEINETLQIKEKRPVISPEGKRNIKHGRDGKADRTFKIVNKGKESK